MVTHDIMTWRSTSLRHDEGVFTTASTFVVTYPKAVTFSILLLHRDEHFLCCETQQHLFSFNSLINLLDFHSITINLMLFFTLRR